MKIKPTYALLIIDMINDLEFSSGVQLLPHALDAAEKITVLKKEVKALDIPVIYVNDNYGKWQSDFRYLVDHCLQEEVRGKPLANMLQPDESDYFILKPKYSGFYATPLELLLEHLNINTLILTGVTGDMCVQFTANDAYMRNFGLMIPSDCVASHTHHINQQSLHTMKEVVKADISPSSLLLEKLKKNT
ncbi:cysteine hydrolase family protein [Halalkalibacter krulwichiae]|uniref:Isochorismatase family protein YecD n=1 Tax=Halalkalibacter krulwichiae TaxID=199441 RepID=A0A1X9MEM0_9BACI|nr:isochorismatase family cysteine hydrolase [Halalkalibacter krulwichiae]ARK31889.1 Isochorismatase family protein YecD [Halalkalibacter krulwichiae]